MSASANSMTRRNPKRIMDQIYSRAPRGDEYPIEFAPTGPEDRGQLGRVRIRGQNGTFPTLRHVWWLRCPWCREMVELPSERIHVDAGLVRIDGTIACGCCETIYEIADGRAVRWRAGRDDVDSPESKAAAEEGT